MKKMSSHFTIYTTYIVLHRITATLFTDTFLVCHFSVSPGDVRYAVHKLQQFCIRCSVLLICCQALVCIPDSRPHVKPRKPVKPLLPMPV